MPVWPGSTARAGLIGLALAGLAAMPLVAQSEVDPAAPAGADATQSDESLRPSIGLPATATTPTISESADGTTSFSAADLEEVEASLTLSRERIEELQAEIAAMQGDQTQQNAALIAADQRVSMAEIEIADVEDRLSGLIVSEMEVRGRLDGADVELANVLAALERISLNPPPALIVDPSDALGSARGAMLIAAIVPQLRAKADTVSADLAELTRIREQAEAEESTLRANYEVLEEEQLRIATLIAARKQGLDAANVNLSSEQAQATELAERASSLRELIDALSARAAQPAGPDEPDGPTLSPEAIHLAFANAARTEPAVPFAMARGYLSQPSTGRVVLQFGNRDGMGGIARGQSIVTAAAAPVVAPADGWVLYKGPYLNYGQIVILNTGQGYTALLAGLDTISVEIGQFVKMGDPLGLMGSRTIGRTITTSAGNGQPTLYIELRQNNEPIDPERWWAQNEQTG